MTTSTAPAAPDLPDDLRAALDLERTWAVAPRPGVTKEREVRERLGLTPTRYRLLRAVPADEAEALAALTVAVRQVGSLAGR